MDGDMGYIVTGYSSIIMDTLEQHKLCLKALIKATLPTEGLCYELSLVACIIQASLRQSVTIKIIRFFISVIIWFSIKNI